METRRKPQLARPSIRARTTCTSLAETRARLLPPSSLVFLMKDKGAPVLTPIK
jgi:hypothetical protein